MDSSQDSLFILKHISYCRVFSSTSVGSSFEDFIRNAKFQLCKKTKTLWKDPIWEDYTDEEIIIEYFSLIFSDDEDYRKEFEKLIGKEDTETDDIYEWLDSQIKKNEEIMKREEEALQEVITFDPSELGVNT